MLNDLLLIFRTSVVQITKYQEETLGLPLANTLETWLWAGYGWQRQWKCEYAWLRILSL